MPTFLQPPSSGEDEAAAVVATALAKSRQRHRLSWRLRDAAQDLLEDRQALFLDAHEHYERYLLEQDSSKRSKAAASSSSSKNKKLIPLTTCRFDTDAAVERLVTDQAVLPQIFDWAAQSVLKAIQTSQAQVKAEQDDDDNIDIDEDDDLLFDSPLLPSCILELRHQVAVQRQTSLERSHENKEYTKRKGGKVDPDVVAAAAAAAATPKPKPMTWPAARARATTTTTTTSTAKKQQPRAKASSTSTTAAAAAAPKTSSSTKKIKLKLPTTKKSATATTTTTTKSTTMTSSAVPVATTSSSATATAPAAAAAAATTTTTAVATTTTTSSSSAATSNTAAPKFTRNTPASSAAALDARFTSSRAILCAAGNLALSRLTPGPAIDVLDVPQNPNSRQKSSSATTTTTTTSTTTSTDAPSTTTTTTTAVNMGAVVVEAQTLGQRAMAVVENSIRRAALRYQYRRDNARYQDHYHQQHLHNNEENTLFVFRPVSNPFDWNQRQRTTITSAADAPPPPQAEEVSSSSSSAEDTASTTSAISPSSHSSIPHNPHPTARQSSHWQTTGLPRFLNILNTGAGHAVYHDLEWSTRHGRLAHLLQTLATTTTTTTTKNAEAPNWGPHLIVTTQPQVARFTQEFYNVQEHLGLIISAVNIVENSSSGGGTGVVQLRALAYQGTRSQRRQLRREYFGQASGLARAPFHVLVTSYANFFKDYLHFCQVPFEVVVMDDGLRWMAAAQADVNSSLRHLWDTALFSANDQHAGLAAGAMVTTASSTTTSSSTTTTSTSTRFQEWDYNQDYDGMMLIGSGSGSGSGKNVSDHHHHHHHHNMAKDALVGLTARHRIVTASSFTQQSQRNSSSSSSTAFAMNSANPAREIVYVSCLVNFLMPHFAAVVREEWDRSRITTDVQSMKHFRTLVARATVVHVGETTTISSMNNATVHGMDQQQQDALIVDALAGTLAVSSSRHQFNDDDDDPPVPRIVPDEEFVSSGKVTSSRRWTLAWLGPADRSWMRYELGTALFEPILDVMKLSNHHGSYCEEITTASSTTSSGASGQVAGTMAYRLAVRCGRHFGSEQGLRQHISALHAPPGTWLCRTCSTDCATSQARTHHERSCGQPANGGMEGDPGATPVVGQGGGPKSGVGKKKKGGRTGASQQGATPPEEKDPDGSFRVPGYRGVWINTAGKHFVKIDGKRYAGEDEGSTDILIFDSVDDAAKKYDQVAKNKNKEAGKKLELNFKPDGSRIVYEDITPATTSGLGGSAANVVPALSVINIKDLPADVKPLLRDPRQTSRTGGNSKRHVYAYRGVCRQARKGHDRWQSQISFMGQNHYLGTFDSEWDAAAVYAWAHLILYGEEATRKAQKEGEEAAAAYEQEKRDIAAGKIPAPPAKPEKKKKAPAKKAEKKKAQDTKAAGGGKDAEKPSASKKRKLKSDGPTVSEKKIKLAPPAPPKPKPQATTTAAKQREAIAPILAKGVAKAPILTRRDLFENVSDKELLGFASDKLKAARDNEYMGTASSAKSPADDLLRPCLAMKSADDSKTPGIALLLGISPASSEWDLQGFVLESQLGSEQDTITALQLLAVEYDEDGVNEKFNSIMQGTVCIIGCADRKTQQAYQDLGLGTVPLGGAVGKIDCHIGGVPNSCSEVSACIRYAPTEESDFQIACLCNEDIVSVNGKRLTRGDGPVALHNGDICSVGARVFSFIVAV